MSDELRNLFEKWYQDHPWHHTSDARIKEGMFDAWRAALQSQTAPAESREEIQARALEAYARDLDSVHKSAKRQHASNTPAWYAGQFAKDARAAAARLRASQKEGDQGDSNDS